MKMKKLLLFAAAASLSFSAFADDLATGEWTEYKTGQATNDHLFVRGEYDDATYDNVISFKGGTPQLVWFWLDDDEIYENETVQALRHSPYNAAGDLYNEITYNSFQVDIMLPQSLEIITTENEDGEELAVIQGDRLPTSSVMQWKKKDNTKVVDGITYDWYTIVCYNTNDYGTHLSAKNATKYKNNGALKKDDAPVFGLYIKNNNQAQAESELDNMIMGRLEFGMRETAYAGWDANMSKYIYCTGGNNESNRFELYNRVRVYGSTSVVESLSEKQVKSVKYYNVAGMESNEAFDGVNIMVTTYNDGTTSTAKVLK